MTIQFPVDPAIGFNTCKASLLRKTTILRSPFTGARQAQLFASALWAFDVQLAPVDPTFDPVSTGKLRSFLAQLQGQNQPFYFPIPGVVSLARYIGVNGAVNGAGQTGNQIITNGWPKSTTILLEGDYFSLGNEVKLVTTSGGIASDTNGNATITFEPAIRFSPATGSVVNVGQPTVILTADDDDVATWNLSDPVIHDITFKGTETF